MPVRSLTSFVFAWPDRALVDREARRWAREQAATRPHLVRLGYFGSYARNQWGVGSDLDLVAVVAASSSPFENRALEWDLVSLPVPAEILVYTEQEWSEMQAPDRRFGRMLAEETVWVWPPDLASPTVNAEPGV
jgi:predicted nucleotidyltransferase